MLTRRHFTQANQQPALKLLTEISEVTAERIASELTRRRDAWLLHLIQQIGTIDHAISDYYIKNSSPWPVLQPPDDASPLFVYEYRLMHRVTQEQFGPTFTFRISGSLKVECNF